MITFIVPAQLRSTFWQHQKGTSKNRPCSAPGQGGHRLRHESQPPPPGGTDIFRGALQMSVQLQALKLFFVASFVISILGSMLRLIRLPRTVGVFELLKPELLRFSQDCLNPVKRSFYRSKHWITMSREMMNLDKSARQVSIAKHFGKIPIVSIKASSFFKPSFWSIFIPLKDANKLREKMHIELCSLSADYLQAEVNQSGHFVWIDQPDVIVDAVKTVLNKIGSSC
jgi:hypothetical protein